MTELRFETPRDDAALADWRQVHNLVIPGHVLSLDDVRDRSTRNRLETAYLGRALVGCSTVRPPTATEAATVIARVLPEYRRRGFGTRLYERCLAAARGLGATTIATVVLASNTDGLRFALRNGFAETERYRLPGDDVAWVDLRLTP